MTRTFRDRLTLLGTASLFAVALVAAPVQFSTVTADLAVAHAAGLGDGPGGSNGVTGPGGSGAGGSGSSSGGGGGATNGTDSVGGDGGRGGGGPR